MQIPIDDSAIAIDGVGNVVAEDGCVVVAALVAWG